MRSCGGGSATSRLPGSGFPWTTFAINVSGCFALACLPAAAAVRTDPALAAALGPGLLGGYTTMSAYAEETRALLADDRALTAAGLRRRHAAPPAWSRCCWPSGSPGRPPSAPVVEP